MTGLRREPVQQRSKERVERILAAAAELLCEGGPDALRPTEVARRAEVPVGSVYQYFEDKAAILRVLVDRYFERASEALDQGPDEATTLDEVLDRLRDAAEAWYVLHRDEPVWQQVLHGILADKDLQYLNLEDSRRNSRRIADALIRVAPDIEPEAIRRSVLVVNHLFVAALQLALSEESPERREALYRVWVGMATAEILRVSGARRETA